MATIYTIGHSNHTYEVFAGLLAGHGIEVLADLRSSPYSRYTPHFDRELLQRSLMDSGVKYVYLGRELGGRPENPSYYDGSGHVLYGRITADPVFAAGIQRLERGIAEFKVAAMCSEEDPAHCHRRLLVGRVLAEHGHQVLHIRGDGSMETDAEVAAISGKELVCSQPALFAELEEDQWKSTVSVSPRKAPESFSTH